MLLIYSILSFLLGLTHNTEAHEFHLSRTIVKHNVAESALQISLHLYIDDFEDALKKQGHDSLYLCSSKENTHIDSFITAYLTEHLVFVADGKPLDYIFLGKEISEDLAGVWMYLEVYNLPKLSSLEIQNKVLTEVFQDQQNIVNVSANGKEKYMRFDINDPIQTAKWK